MRRRFVKGLKGAGKGDGRTDGSCANEQREGIGPNGEGRENNGTEIQYVSRVSQPEKKKKSNTTLGCYGCEKGHRTEEGR